MKQNREKTLKREKRERERERSSNFTSTKEKVTDEQAIHDIWHTSLIKKSTEFMSIRKYHK